MVDVFRNLLLVPEGDVVVEGDESENGDEEGDEKDESIGTTAALQRNVLPTHKRSLSAYSEMPTQPHQKKISITEHLVARYAMHELRAGIRRHRELLRGVYLSRWRAGGEL